MYGLHEHVSFSRFLPVHVVLGVARGIFHVSFRDISSFVAISCFFFSTFFPHLLVVLRAAESATLEPRTVPPMPLTMHEPLSTKPDLFRNNGSGERTAGVAVVLKSL